MRPQRDDRGELLRGLGELSAIGLTLVAATGIGALLGWWIGKKLGATTIGLIAGVLLGSLAGFIEVFRTVKRYNR